MNVLIACEESQIETIEFRKKGNRAFSCDLQKCSGGFPGWHVIGNAVEILKTPISFQCQDGSIHCVKKWDLLIAHPPCTYLSNAAAHLLRKGGLNQERFLNGLKAAELFYTFLYSDIERICVENPVPDSLYQLPHYDQIINPYDFGHEYSKRTCLWLKNLPGLFSTEIVMDRKSFVFTRKCKNNDRGKERSKSFKGIAKAMAEQWSI